MIRRLGFVVLLVLCAAPARGADETPLPPGEGKPILQLEAGGPTAAVTALLFSADGKTLYAAGLDKVVRVWEQELAANKPVWTLKRSFRVPIGPGVSGAINALALSGDGRWLAVGGRSVMRGEADFQHPGVVVPITALSEPMWRDGGNIYVFDLKNPAGGKVLRGHPGEVRALAFAPERPGKPPLLVSAAYEYVGGKPVGGGLRLWDADKGGEALAVMKGHVPALQENPGLVVWRTGDGNTDVRAALSWPEADVASGDGHLRLWDATTGTLKSWEFGSGNSTAVFLGLSNDEPRVAAGNVRKSGDSLTSRLSVLQFSRDRDPQVQSPRKLDLSFDRVSYRPLALAAVSANANGRLDHVAAVLQPGDPDLGNVLALTNVSADPAEITVRFSLKNTDPVHAPVVAAAPRGKWLAVAGFKDRAIEIYSIEDLLEKRTTPTARLRSQGVLYSKAVFVRRDKEVGLWLSEDPKAAPLEDGAYFNFDKRSLTNDAKGWVNDTPSRAGWDVDFKDGMALVSHGGTVFRLKLYPGAEPTWYALLPATAQRKQTLFALAHTNRASAETYITLYDVESGRALRRFSGHLQDVRWLAFSDTQPLLVSVAEDQTVRVWSFADLNINAGLIEGMAVGQRDGKVVVVALDPKSAAATAGLKVDDVLEGFVGADGKVKRLKTADEVYWTVRLKKPNETIDVKIAGQAAPVRVPVGRGIEERKPLLSLFVTRDRREWIGWSPGGPFDRSSDNVETLIGWQVNTGKPERPVTFDSAKEDHGKFYKQDILKHLVSKGSLEGALEEMEMQEKPPEAEVTTRVDGGERLDQRADLFRTRQQNVKLIAKLNATYPLDAKDRMTWRAVAPDGSKSDPQPMQRIGGEDEHLWEADLLKLPWKQGEFHIEAVFHSAKYDKSKSQALTLRYQPPAPQLAAVVEKTQLKVGEKPIVLNVMDPKLVVEISVKPQPGQSVEVRFLQPGAKDKESRTIAKDETFTQEFKLQQGPNSLEIVAINDGALKGFEALETSVLRFKVNYKIGKMPIIAALVLDPAGEVGRRDGDRNVLVVTVPQIKVTSTISAEDPLALADWSIDGKAKSLLPAQATTKLDVKQTIDLQAGQTTELRLRATTKGSKASEETLRVVYRPLLPRTSLVVDGGAEVFRNQATVSGKFRGGSPNEPYRATLRSADENGKALAKEIVLKPDAEGKWSALVPLARGANIVTVTVRSDCRDPETSSVTVAYKQPPVLDPVAEVKVGQSPLVTFEASIWSPPGAKPLSVTINERAFPGVEFRETKDVKNGLTRWLATIRKVPVKVGEDWLKVLVLNVNNADGWSLQPVTVAIIKPVAPPPLLPPTVQLRIQGRADTVQQSEYLVPIFVQSDGPLQSITLWRGKELLYELDGKKVPKDGTRFVLDTKLKVNLNWEANPLKLVAVNDGGQRSDEATVTATRPPVNVLVDRIDLLEPNGEVKKSVEPTERMWEKVRFDELTRGFVFLHGHVEWPDENDERLDANGLNVVVYVNGARQFPVALEPRGSGKQRNQRAFHVPVVLGQAKDNKVEIELPVLKQEGSSRRTFLVDCAQPLEKRRLHVLIIGVDVANGERLKTSFLSKLGEDLPRGFQGEFKSPAFSSAYLAGVLCDTVQKEDVLGQLGDIADSIRKLQKQAPGQNDVVLIFFQGTEARDAKGNRYLKTSKNEAYPTLALETTAIAYNELTPMPGVQLLVLNVARSGTPSDLADQDWKPADQHVGFMRYVWRNVEEVRKPVPTIVGYWGGALRTGASTLGEIDKMVNEEVKKGEKALATSQIPDVLQNLQLSKPQK